MGGGGGDTGPTTEGFGIVPAICLAPVGLALLPADRKLVRGACKQRQSSPTCPQGQCLRVEKKGGTNPRNCDRKKGKEGNKENKRGEKCKTARWKIQMREQKC